MIDFWLFSFQYSLPVSVHCLLSHHSLKILNWWSATSAPLKNLPSHQITHQMKNITILSLQSWFLPNALIKVCWCRPPQAIDYVSADIKRVRDSTLHSMWVAERNSSIRRTGEWWWGFPLKTRGGRADALSVFFITDCSLKGLVAFSFS